MCHGHRCRGCMATEHGVDCKGIVEGAEPRAEDQAQGQECNCTQVFMPLKIAITGQHGDCSVVSACRGHRTAFLPCATHVVMVDLNWQPDNECPAKWEETAGSLCDVEVATCKYVCRSEGWISGYRVVLYCTYVQIHSKLKYATRK